MMTRILYYHCHVVSAVFLLLLTFSTAFGVNSRSSKVQQCTPNEQSFLAGKKSSLFQSAIPLEGDNYEQDGGLDWIQRGGSTVTVTPPTSSLANLYNAYLTAIERNPLLTKGMTAAIVNVLGDILAQLFEASTAGALFVPNWARLQGFFLCGLIYTGPYVHTWYEQLWKLGSWMEKKFDSPKRVQTIDQLIVDQTIGVAIFFSTYFYVYEVIDALVSHRCK